MTRRLLPLLLGALALSCSDSTPAQTEVFTATASVSPHPGLVDAPMQFQVALSGGQSPYQFGWLFGDGRQSSEPSPTHSYVSAGTFTVRLEVEDAKGQRAATQIHVVVVDNAAATANAQALPSAGAAPLSVQFTGSGTGDPPVRYQWEFGDGTLSNLQSPTHTYHDAGTYVATLTVSDANGSSASQPITISVSAAPPGPGPDRQPIAAPVVLDPRGTAPHAARMVANATGGNGALTYLWEFGDGSTSTEENPTHTFGDPGVYAVQFTATDEDGDEARATLFVEALADQLPSVSITQAFPVVGCGSVTTTFRAQASGGDQPYTYSWDFGDGSTGTGEQVTHLYASAGNYIATVTATDVDGDTAQATRTVSVRPLDEMSLSMSASPSIGQAPLETNFTLSVTCGRAPFTVSWDFGDGLTSTGRTALKHRFDAPGEYDVRVIVSDSTTPTPLMRILTVRINVLDSIPRVAVPAFTATPTGNQVCYDAKVENTGTGATTGCFGFRSDPEPAQCGVLAAVFPHQASPPAAELAPSNRVGLLRSVRLEGSSSFVDLRACLGLLRQGAAALRFFPGSVSPGEQWPVSICLPRPPGSETPWFAAALNDANLVAARPDLAFAVAGLAAPVNQSGLKVNEIASSLIELRGPPGMSLSGFTLEIERSGGQISSCPLTGALDTSGLAKVESGCSLPLPMSGFTVRAKNGSTTLDVVGVGLDAPASEGSPAPALTTGSSVGRSPDGVDRDDNATDLIALPSPSAGLANPAPGDLASGPLPLQPNTCVAFSLANATARYTGYGPSSICTPGDCSGPEQVIALDLASGSYRLDLVGFEAGTIVGWFVVRADGLSCDPAGELLAAGVGDGIGKLLSDLTDGRYCVFVEGAGGGDYAALLTPAAL